MRSPDRKGSQSRAAVLSAVFRVPCALVVAAVLSGFAFLLITGKYTEEVKILFVLTPGHGVHAGDLFVAAGWAAAVVALVVVLSKRD